MRQSRKGEPMRSDPVVGEESCPCKFCGRPTRMTGTKQCDECWELYRRLKEVPEEVLFKMVEEIKRD